MQADLFSLANLVTTVPIPPAPVLRPHTTWPFPGETPEDSARAGLANSCKHADMVAAVVLAQGGAELTDSQVLALVPTDWRALLGPFAHGSISPWEGEQRGIDVRYVAHEGGGFHFTYSAAVSPKVRV